MSPLTRPFSQGQQISLPPYMTRCSVGARHPALAPGSWGTRGSLRLPDPDACCPSRRGALPAYRRPPWSSAAPCCKPEAPGAEGRSPPLPPRTPEGVGRLVGFSPSHKTAPNSPSGAGSAAPSGTSRWAAATQEALTARSRYDRAAETCPSGYRSPWGTRAEPRRAQKHFPAPSPKVAQILK